MRRKSRKDKVFVLSLFFCIISLLLLITIALPNNWFGWVLFYGSFAILITSKIVRENRRVFYSSLFVLTIHQFVALINSYVKTIPGAEKDAISFHSEAIWISRFTEVDLINTGSDLYVNFLAMFYKLFGESIFLGGQLSIMAFTVSILLILKISKILDFNSIVQKYIVLLFGLFPSVIIFTSVTLRESFQILFVISICYLAIKLKVKKSIRGLILLTTCILLFCLLHKGLLILAPVITFITFYWIFKKKKSSVVNILGLSFSFLIMLGMLFFLSSGPLDSSTTTALYSGNGADYASSYRTNSDLDSRAAYGVKLDTTSIFGLLKTFPAVVFSYFFAPFPWQIGSVLDILTLLENFVRLILLIYGIKLIQRSDGEKKAILKYLFILFLLVEVLWSLGTVNWGTAMRHHIVVYPLILIIGGGNCFNIFIKKRDSENSIPTKQKAMNKSRHVPKTI